MPIIVTACFRSYRYLNELIRNRYSLFCPGSVVTQGEIWKRLRDPVEKTERTLQPGPRTTLGTPAGQRSHVSPEH